MHHLRNLDNSLQAEGHNRQNVVKTTKTIKILFQIIPEIMTMVHYRTSGNILKSGEQIGLNIVAHMAHRITILLGSLSNAYS